jgi:hypothetical protein
MDIIYCSHIKILENMLIFIFSDISFVHTSGDWACTYSFNFQRITEIFKKNQLIAEMRGSAITPRVR